MAGARNPLTPPGDKLTHPLGRISETISLQTQGGARNANVMALEIYRQYIFGKGRGNANDGFGNMSTRPLGKDVVEIFSIWKDLVKIFPIWERSRFP